MGSNSNGTGGNSGQSSRQYKVISMENFADTAADKITESRVDIAWPVFVVSVSLPLCQDADNVFDALVMGLARVGITDAAEIAKISCLDKDFISIVQASLRDRGMLSSRFDLTDTGIEAMSQGDTAKQKEAFVLQDRISGNVLPFIGLSAPRYELASDESGNRMKFSKGTQGKSFKVTAHRIYHDKNMPKEVSEKDIRGAYKQFERNIRRKQTDGEIRLPRLATGKVTIAKGAEKAYLHCTASMKKGGKFDVPVTDGVTGSYSDLLTGELLHSGNADGIINRLKNLLRDSAGGGAPLGQGGETAKRSVADSTIGGMISDAEKNITDKPPAGDSEYEIQQKGFCLAVKKLYAAIEKTLLKVVKSGNTLACEVLLNGSRESNAKAGRTLVAKAGFKMSEKEGVLFDAVPPGKIKTALEGSACEMQPLLLMSIYQASQDAMHPMNSLAAQFPDALTFLCSIKMCRDSVMHGASERGMEAKQVKSFARRTRKMASILLKENMDEGSAAQTMKADDGKIISDWENRRLKASIALDKKFGVMVMQRIESSWKELLYNVQMAYDENDGEAVVQECCSLLQRVIHDVYMCRRETGEVPKDIIATGENRAKEAGLLPEGGQLPLCLARVNKERALRAVNGVDITLSANMTALLAMAESALLKQLQRDVPNIIPLVEDLANRRGHGNEIKDMDKEDIAAIKDSVLDCTKKLEVLYD